MVKFFLKTRELWINKSKNPQACGNIRIMVNVEEFSSIINYMLTRIKRGKGEAGRSKGGLGEVGMGRKREGRIKRFGRGNWGVGRVWKREGSSRKGLEERREGLEGVGRGKGGIGRVWKKEGRGRKRLETGQWRDRWRGYGGDRKGSGFATKILKSNCTKMDNISVKEGWNAESKIPSWIYYKLTSVSGLEDIYLNPRTLSEDLESYLSFPVFI